MEGRRRGASSSDWSDRRRHHQQRQRGGRRGGVGPTQSSSNYMRPHLASGSCQPMVPSWEKKFCTSVGLISWGKLCETKKSMYLYRDVVEWDDSAGEEAFRNAKARYWAEINGLPCDIASPGPDIYIDNVDWDSEIDPQLLLDLDEEPPPPPVEETNNGNWDGTIPCTGWGDAEDATSPVKDTQAETGWGNGNNDNNGNNGNNGWENKLCSNSRGRWENRSNEVDYSESRRYGRRKEGGGRYDSRFQTWRYRGNNGYYQANNGNWRNCRGGMRTNHQNEHPTLDKQRLAPPRHWNSMQACGPMNRRASAEAGGAWRWEKIIS